MSVAAVLAVAIGGLAAPLAPAALAAEPIPVTVPPATPTPEFPQVDRSGRTVVLRPRRSCVPGGLCANTAYRIDRVTRDVVALPPSYADATSADGSVIIDGDLRWVDLSTGATSPPLAVAGSLTEFRLSEDGHTVAVDPFLLGQGFVLSMPSGARQDVPDAIAGHPIALSANGRYVLVHKCVTVVHPYGASCDAVYRWDRVTGRTGRVDVYPNVIPIVGDNGSVIVSLGESADGTRWAVDRADGTRRALPAQRYASTPRLDGDGTRALATLDTSLGQWTLGVIEVDTGGVVPVFVWSKTALAPPFIAGTASLSGDGTTVVYVPNTFVAEPYAVAGVTVPGSSPSARIRAGEVFRLPVAGREGVPADAEAVALNVTVTDPALAGFVTVWPCGADRPLASNVNAAAGGTVANAVIARVGADGAVCLGANVDVNLVVDLQGWFPVGSSYAPLVPARLVDTRNGELDPVPNLAADTELRVPVTGRAGVGADATAVALNVTVTNPAAAGFVTVWPCDRPRPLASNLNMAAGQTVAGAVISAVGSGAVCAWSNVATDVVVDVQGAFGAGAGHVPEVPYRLLDSRQGQEDAVPNLPAGEVSVSAGAVEEAIVVNVTVTNPAAAGFVTVWPCDEPRPLASSVNVVAGQTVPNLVLVATGAGRRVCTWSNVAVDLVIDRQGAFAGTATFRPVTPVRLLDTRA